MSDACTCKILKVSNSFATRSSGQRFKFFISYFIGGSGYASILIRGLIFTVVYIPLMWFMGMNSYEKNLFKAPVIKISRKLGLKGY